MVVTAAFDVGGRSLRRGARARCRVFAGTSLERSRPRSVVGERCRPPGIGGGQCSGGAAAATARLAGSSLPGGLARGSPPPANRASVRVGASSSRMSLAGCPGGAPNPGLQLSKPPVIVE